MVAARWRAVWQALQHRWGQRAGLPGVAIDIDAAWATCFEMRLADSLQAVDVWFQLHAQAAAQTGLTHGALALDYLATPDVQPAQIHYRVFAVPVQLLTRLQTVVQQQGLRLTRLGLCDGTQDAGTSVINFLPHRQLRLRAQQRTFAVRCGCGLLLGVVMAGVVHGLQWVLAQEALPEAAVQLQTQQQLSAAQRTHSDAQRLLQQQLDAQARRQARWSQQQPSLQWQALLQDPSVQLWYAQISQEGTTWRVVGEALNPTAVTHLQTQLTPLPIWQTPPELKAWHALPASALRWPVWQFELAGTLKDTAVKGEAMKGEAMKGEAIKGDAEIVLKASLGQTTPSGPAGHAGHPLPPADAVHPTP